MRVSADALEASGFEAAWRALHRAAPSASPVQGPDFYRAARRAEADHGPSSLRVITAHDGDDLVGLWAVQLRRAAGLGVVESLGFGALEDYGGPLVRPGPLAARRAGTLLAAAAGLGDVARALVLADHPLLRSLGGRLAWGAPVASPVARLGRAGAFDAFLAGKSSSFRKGLRYDRRRLAARWGPLALLGPSPEDLTEAVDWLLRAKAAWMQALGLAAPWIVRTETRAMLLELLGPAAPASGVELYVLTAGGAPVAGALCLVGGGALELVLITHDETFSAHSPGNLLIEDLARICAARGLDLDFKITRDFYKLRWADDGRTARALTIALTARGAPPVLGAMAHDRFLAARGWGRRRLEAAGLLSPRRGRGRRPTPP